MQFSIDSEKNIIEVGGVKINLDALRALVEPDPNAFYRFERKGDQIQANIFYAKEGASGN